MEATTVRSRMVGRIKEMVKHAIVKDRRFLDDEQLIRSEQLAVLEEVFNAKVRDAEIQELSSHFAGILRGDHPCHLAIWGKTGTGKTLTLSFFLNLLAEMARAENVPIRHEHLDLSTPRPCFRALNDLACLLGASKRYKKGISLEELMLRIEARLAAYRGYLILFIDEVDNVRRDRDTFLTFLVPRLPQRIERQADPDVRIQPLELAGSSGPAGQVVPQTQRTDLQTLRRGGSPAHSPDSRGEGARPGSVEPGVVEKIAAMASQDHGDARKAVALLGKSAYLAEKAGTKISLEIVADAATELDRDRYLMLLRSAPRQLQATMAAVIEATHKSNGAPIGTGEAYDAYVKFCGRAGVRTLTGRAFGDLLAELDMYSLLRSRVLSRGRYGRTREIVLDLSEGLVEKIYAAIRMNFEMRG